HSVKLTEGMARRLGARPGAAAVARVSQARVGALRAVRSPACYRARPVYDRSANVGLPFLITQTAGAERKFPVPACLVILPAVPAYSVMRRTCGNTPSALSKPSTNMLNESYAYGIMCVASRLPGYR